jgi:hypothetical protein
MQKRIEGGVPTKVWDERPILPEDLGWAWRAWEELSTCRPYTMAGAGPIPWSAVNDYCLRYGLTLDEQEEMGAYVRALDAEYLKRDEDKE